MAETGKINNQNGKTIKHQSTESCTRNYKPWVWTLVIMALITLGWTVFESYQEGGIVKALIETDDYNSMASGNMPGLHNSGGMPVAGNTQNSYHTIIENVRPAVVSIDADTGIPAPNAAGQFGVNYARAGSGVIIDPKGFVLSSLHVVAGAKSLRASVYGPHGLTYFPLKVVNVDKASDLVLLRIIGPGPFQHAILGNSDLTRTGDVVLAMGSPFGFDHTITTGIISSRNRTLNIDGRMYEGVLQIDAPINSGNSGGPLVSTNGEVVGINTAIYSPTGAFSGIGFSIPVNRASTLVAGVVNFQNSMTQVASGQIANWVRMGRQVGNSFKLPNRMVVKPPHTFRGKCTDCHPQLLDPAGLTPAQILPGSPQTVAMMGTTNAVPFIGATFLEVGPVIADQFDLLHPGGVLVDRVYAATPAQEAGLVRGDIIVRVNGKRIDNINELKQMLASEKIGKKFKMDLISNGARKRIKVKTMAQPPFMPGPPMARNALREVGWLGSEISPLTPAVQPYVKTGVYVSDADGVLRAAGVMKGDVIKAINNNPVTDMVSFMSLKSRLNVQNGLLLDIIRSGNPMYITVRG